jgi:hypothetical protein
MIRKAWEIECTDEFVEWWRALDEMPQERIGSALDLLAERGTTLPYPLSSSIRGSKHGGMRELRVQWRGRPLRVLYAFDPRRQVIVLLGGDKTGNDRFYGEVIPTADRLYDEYLDELRFEGLI